MHIPNKGGIRIEWLAARWPVSQGVQVDREPAGEVALLWIIVPRHILVRVRHHGLHGLRRLLRHDFV